MTDDKSVERNQNLDKLDNLEDRALERLFERLDRGENLVEFSDAERLADLTHEHTELLGLLAHALEPTQPSAGLRDLILDQARLEAARQETPGRSEEARRADVLPFHVERGENAPPRRAARGDFGRGFLALAAALALCVLGLGFLAQQMNVRDARLTELRADLEATRGEAERLRDELSRSAVPTHFATVARSAYAMRPASQHTADSVGGMVYICEEHQHWFLDVKGLEPAPTAHEYQLWFVTDQGMLPAGTVTLRGEKPKLSMEHLPIGTRGFALSLEEAGEHAEPRGEMVLLGDETLIL